MSGAATLLVVSLLGLGYTHFADPPTRASHVVKVTAETTLPPLSPTADVTPDWPAPPSKLEPVVHETHAGVPSTPAASPKPAQSAETAVRVSEADPQVNLGGIPHGAGAAAGAQRADDGAIEIGQVPPPPPPAARPTSLSAMVGQMIVVGFVGMSASDPGAAAAIRQLSDGVIGGVMWMGRNVRNKQQVQALNDRFHAANASLVPLISVDQEGGLVQRLKRNGFTPFPSAQMVASSPKWNSGGRALQLYGSMAGQLSSAGFNVNFGPVVDLNTNPNNPVIGRVGRSYGANPDTVIDFARDFSAAHKQKSILTAAKHFPGHGSSRVDSHKGFTDISQTWKPVELKPYRDLAQDGMVDMVMVGHLYHPKFSDGDGIPTSLSRRAVAYLRNDIGFQGVVVSDDMEMGALRKHFSSEDAIVRAVNAGVDILVFSNTAKPSAEFGRWINGVIVKAVNSGRIERATVERAYQRIRAMKRTLARQPQTPQNG